MKKPRPSSNIPEARKRLLAVANQLPGQHADEIREIRRIVHDLMTRGYSDIPRAPKRRHSLNPKLAAKLRDYKTKHPDYSQEEIGFVFDVAGGRVSEALAGHDWSPSRTGQKK